MNKRNAVFGLCLVVAACGRSGAAPAADTLAVAKQRDDSVIALRTQQAPALADTARVTLASLLKQPESALFDSIVVVQPPKENGSWSAPWVCGRIGGKPGIGGRSTMTPFVYQNRINVFVLDKDNAAAFAALRAKGCENPGARVVLK